MTVETANDLMEAELARLHQTVSPAISTVFPRSIAEFGGPGGTVTEADYQRMADALGCGVAAVRAVGSVETACAPFLSDGTGRPSILFEAHVFNRYTNGRFLNAKDRHGVALATAEWDKTTYGQRGTHQYERLEDACALDKHAALMATSWGMFQIMGFNWKDAGFASCEGMVAAMSAGPAAHLAAFADFIRANRLDSALRATPPDFETFAAKYNGVGDVADYAAKMKSRYEALLDSSPAGAPARAPASDNFAIAGVTQGTEEPAISAHAAPVRTTGSMRMPDINYGAALTDAASYAAGGMVLGPPGAIIGGLIGFASDVVPALLPHLFGKNSPQVYAQVKNVMAAATGGKTDPKDIQAVMTADPAKAEVIKQRLTEIAATADEAQRQADLQQRQVELEQLKVALADTANARAEMAVLVKAGTPIAWGAPVVSVLVLMMFIATVLVAFWPFQAGSHDPSPLLNAVLGTLGTMSTAVVTYWVGSSAGSAQKTALLAKAQPVA